MLAAFVFVFQARLEMQGAIKKYMGQLTDTTVPIKAERREVTKTYLFQEVWRAFLSIMFERKLNNEPNACIILE